MKMTTSEERREVESVDSNPGLSAYNIVSGFDWCGDHEMTA